MEKKDYLKILVEQIHSTTIATIAADGHPQTRVIDMMLWDENGEYFDISDPSHIVRDSFVIGNATKTEGDYFVQEGCTGCQSCLDVCPQKCIDITRLPVEIAQNHCLHCGRCEEICPEKVIVRR